MMNFKDEVVAITNAYCAINGLPIAYPKAGAQGSGAAMPGTHSAASSPLVAPAPTQHDFNRRWEGLVEILQEFIEVHGFEDALGALHEADMRDREKQVDRDEAMARGR